MINDDKFMLAEDYADASIADNTKIAYAKDLARFHAWGGKIPSDKDQLCAYLTEHAKTHKAATLQRWIASISQAHQLAGFESPTRAIEVRRTFTGIKHTHVVAQRRMAPIMTDMLMAIVDAAPDTLTGKRDTALVLLGFSGAMRRSETSHLKFSDLRFEFQGVSIDFGKTKTDQDGEDSKVAIPNSKNKKYCPVSALREWLKAAQISSGPVFRSINRYGTVGQNALSTQAVADIIKKLVASVGVDPSLYSGHSMRSGLATSAAKAKKSMVKIKEITRHKSDASLVRYIRDGEKYNDNAADLF